MSEHIKWADVSVIGQAEQFSWANDMTPLGILAVLLVVIFLYVVPKIIDAHKDVLVTKFDTLIAEVKAVGVAVTTFGTKLSLVIRVVVRMASRIKHIEKHHHDLLEAQGRPCKQKDDDEEDELDLENLSA